MAEPLDYTPPKYNPRVALIQKLEVAPESHVEAMLDLYGILQLARDKGMLEIVKGALGSGEKILDVATKTLDTDEVITFIRNVTILTKILGGMNPEILENLEDTLVKSTEEAKSKKPPGIFKIFGRLTNSDSRRFMGTVANVMQAIGQHLSEGKTPRLRDEKKQKVMRHRVIG